MNIVLLRLEEFRSYRHLDLCIPAIGCRIVGNNASGKTTLLEAIVVLATSRSPRTQVDRELINWMSGEQYEVPPYCRLQADLESGGERHKVEMSLQVDSAVRTGSKKTFSLDQRSVRAHDVVGAIKVVLFSPDDLLLVSGPPSERRRHLDILISQLDREYLRALSRFNRIVSQRNGLLKSFLRQRVDARSPASEAQLAFWDESLVADGSYIVAKRLQIVELLKRSMAHHGKRLSPDMELDLCYQPRVELGTLDTAPASHGSVDDLRAVIASRFERQLSDARGEEARRGVTVVGPHRDDVMFALDGRPLSQFGSRGQQRLAVVALKLAEATLIREESGDLPILLLDDVLSELDEVHRIRLVAEVVSPGCQVIVTSTEVGSLADEAIAHLPLARVQAGTVSFQQADALAE